jgi:hypothetical protein
LKTTDLTDDDIEEVAGFDEGAGRIDVEKT